METNTLRTDDGLVLRDLNKNGRLDPYEDPRRPIEERVEDLLRQIAVEEKAGLMFHTFVAVDPDDVRLDGPGMFGASSTAELVLARHMSHFNLSQIPTPRQTIVWHNRLQALAERTRLGIPVSISSDPRHAFTRNFAAGTTTSAFSQWP
ncbi:MAG: glycoside hydrolase family 3 protein, partial [Chloroflexi bacterium]|nr:glycoside hydrolase family 3 protein [Chloroflexota bacterium]